MPTAADMLTMLASFEGMGLAERIVYHPSGAVSRVIVAQVDRRPAGPDPETGAMLAPFMVVKVANDDVEGIDAKEFDPGADWVEIAMEYGDETLVEFKGLRRLRHDLMQVEFEVR